ncbi:MAG: thiamine pyrophosphate-dependent enzyme [Candidatus Limnocylindrales bacterium]
MAGPTFSGGRAVAETLVESGIEFAFTVPGESFLGLLDALHDTPIRMVATRHEAGAGFMAEAVGQLTGRPALCLATRAVGAANLAIALHTAAQDSTPLVAVIGQVPREFRGREAFQEVDLVATFGGLCKAAIEVDDPGRLAAETARLIGLARAGRPGPVLLALPEDVLDVALDGPAVARAPEPDRPRPAPAEVAAVLDALAAARSPVILAGAGILRSGRDAQAALVRLAAATETPVVAGWRRGDVFPNAHRLYLGMTGYASPAVVRERLLGADLLLVIGSRLSEVASYDYVVPGPGTRLIQVDIAPGFSGDRRPPDLAVRADASAFLEAALAVLARQPPAADALAGRRAANDAARADFLAAIAIPVPSSPDPRGIHPAAVASALRAHLPAGAIVTTDAGNFSGWAARYVPLPQDARFLGPTSGAMGYGLPAAIGAAVAAPGRTVVALAGDGGFAMLMAELETAVRERLRLVALVHDNGMYGTIRMHQEGAHAGRVVATDLGPIDYAAVAEACGARGLRAERDDEVPGVLEAALAGDGVTVVHLHTDPRALSVDRWLPGA